jgi:hypothetical protein
MASDDPLPPATLAGEAPPVWADWPDERSGRTSGCPTSGSRPTACRASPSPSTWRTRGSRSSRRRRCSRWRAASTSGACASCATRRATRSTTPTSCGAGGSGASSSAVVGALPRVLHAASPYSKSLRAAPRCVVRAEPPGRGLRRDVRRLADARQPTGAALRRLAGAQEAGVHGRADASLAGAAARRQAASRGRAAARAAQDAAAALPAEARHYGVDRPNFYDRDLRRLFSDAPEAAGNMTAAQFLARSAARAPHGRRAGPASTSTRSTRCSKT